MNTNITHENYENIFFHLLEEEYSNGETKRLLKVITADPFLNFEWEQWQQTKVKDQSKTYATQHINYFEDLKSTLDIFLEEPEKKKIVWWPQFMAGAAAVLILLYFYFPSSDVKKNELSFSSKKSQNLLLGSSIEKFSDKRALPKTENGTKHRNNSKVLNPAKKELAFSHKVKKNKVSIKPDTGSIIFEHEQMEQLTVKLDTIMIKSPIKIVKDSEPEVAAVVSKSKVKPKRFTYSVTVEDVRIEEFYTRQELRDMGIQLTDLMDNKQVTIVRKDGQLFLKLNDQDKKIYYVAL